MTENESMDFIMISGINLPLMLRGDWLDSAKRLRVYRDRRWPDGYKYLVVAGKSEVVLFVDQVIGGGLAIRSTAMVLAGCTLNINSHG